MGREGKGRALIIFCYCWPDHNNACRSRIFNKERERVSVLVVLLINSTIHSA